MTPADAAIVAAAEERKANRYVFRAADGELSIDAVSPLRDVGELLRIVRALETLLREREDLAQDTADDAAAETATASRWGS